MKKLMILPAVVFSLFASASLLRGQAEVPDEAKRHFADGLELARDAGSMEALAAAIREFRKAVELAPDWPEAHFNLGLVQANAGQFSEAKKTLKEYIRLFPDRGDCETLNEHIIEAEGDARRQKLREEELARERKLEEKELARKTREQERKLAKEQAKAVRDEVQQPFASSAFTLLAFEFAGKQEIADEARQLSEEKPIIGFSLGRILAGGGDIHSEVRLGYRRMKAEQFGYGALKNISDFSLHYGLRYYPSYPTIRMGRIPVRLTLAALAGADWLLMSEWKSAFCFSGLLSGGLAVSSSSSKLGILCEFVYLPFSRSLKLKAEDGVLHGTLQIKPSWFMRIACMFGS